jgi:putative transposase
MKIQKAYKVELKPNNKQRTLFEKSCGVARFAYNWGLWQRIDLYEKEKKHLTFITQNNSLNEIKKEQFPWMLDVSKWAPSSSLRNLDRAFKSFFKGLNKNKKVGFPKFKSKRDTNQSFSFYNRLSITCSTIMIAKVGRVRLKEKGYIPTEGVKFNSVTISKQADCWFASVQVEQEINDPKPTFNEVIGIDLGIKTLATCSNSQIFENPKNLKKSQRRLKRTQRSVARKIKGSINRLKAIKKLQKIHFKISNQRKDVLHKMTTTLVKTKPRYLVIEDLNVDGMMKNHKLSGALSDVAFGEIRRQLIYKTSWYGGEIILADRFFPSSKTCSNCGNVKEMPLNIRIYECPICGMIKDRDANASDNLDNLGRSTLSSRGIEACGAARAATKQEVNINLVEVI